MLSLTFRHGCSRISPTLHSSQLKRFTGIISNGHITRLVDDVYHQVSHRNQHSLCVSQPLCSLNTLRSLNTSKYSNSLINDYRANRQISSGTVDSNAVGGHVYAGRVSKMLKALKIFSLTTSAIGLAVQPYLWMTFQDLSIGAAIPLFTVLNSFVFLNPILIHFISKKYITDLYFNSDTGVFTAYVLTFFAGKERITFTAADVEVPDVPNMLAMFTLRGRPLFVQEEDFKDVAVYKHLMGFDRPLNLTFLHEEQKGVPNNEDEKKQPS